MSARILYHCEQARSARVIAVLEEMGLPYTLETVRFPPRLFQKDYLGINPLGTVPYFVDGDVRMTESSAICQYLVERHGPTPLAVRPDEPDFGAYLNWLSYADATLTFPQTLVLRYTRLEPEERRNPQAAADYRAFFFGRLKLLTAALDDGRDWLCADRFTIADICVGYGAMLGQILGLDERYSPALVAWIDRMMARPSFQKAMAGTL
jgi:glutathione S-transferase